MRLDNNPYQSGFAQMPELVQQKFFLIRTIHHAGKVGANWEQMLMSHCNNRFKALNAFANTGVDVFCVKRLLNKEGKNGNFYSVFN
ncbi:hypothetical protein ACP5PY_06180 [Photobacterium leiognathi subsp. mandapamensis]